jgi:hypothetical protein
MKPDYFRAIAWTLALAFSLSVWAAAFMLGARLAGAAT